VELAFGLRTDDDAHLLLTHELYVSYQTVRVAKYRELIQDNDERHR